MEYVLAVGDSSLALQSSSPLASVEKLANFALGQVAMAADEWENAFVIEVGSWIFRLDERDGRRWQMQAFHGGDDQWSDDATTALEVVDSQFRTLSAAGGIAPTDCRVDSLVLVHEDLYPRGDRQAATVELRRRAVSTPREDETIDSGWYLGPVGATEAPRPDQLVSRSVGSLMADYLFVIPALTLPLGTIVGFADDAIVSISDGNGSQYWGVNRAGGGA